MTYDATALRRESERLLAGEAPAAPEPAAAHQPVLLPGEELLTADDWDRINSEPAYKRDAFRRSLIEMRQGGADTPHARQPLVDFDRRAERVAWRVLNRWLDANKARNGGFLTGKTLEHLLPSLADRIGGLLRQRDARIADLERRLSALEARQAGGHD